MFDKFRTRFHSQQEELHTLEQTDLVAVRDERNQQTDEFEALHRNMLVEHRDQHGPVIQPEVARNIAHIAFERTTTDFQAIKLPEDDSAA